VLPPLGYATYLIATLAVTMLLADLMRRFVERPTIRLGHLHDRWVSNRRVLTVVAPPVAALAVEPIPAPANDALAGPSTQQA
jgi:peptidoglycan/LPS O-acetylase OafA/YrhL